MGPPPRFLMLRSALVLTLALLLSACASTTQQVQEYQRQDEWLKAVVAYREALAEEPDNVEYKLLLAKTELRAAQYYLEQGLERMEQGETDEAIAQFQQGLIAQPDHDRLRQELDRALARKEAESLYQQALRYDQAGRLNQARSTLERVLDLFPEHQAAQRALNRVEAQLAARDESGLRLASSEPVTLNFRQTDLRTAFEFIARSFGINVVFDDEVEDAPITLFARNVTFQQSLDLLLATTRTFYKRIGPNTLLIAPDAPDKRAQYEDQLVRTFHLNTVGAKAMLDILKGVVAPKKVIVNEELNTLIVRDAEPVLRQVARLVELNDRVPAEVLVDVEILEVNRSKALRLGFDFGSEITQSYEQAGSLSDALATRTITLPAITFRYFKQDVDARTLANPKIRVINARTAKIHIGDRVPLRASTIQDATGQTRTTFNYTDIGVRVTVDPSIHLDDSVTIKLGLEVSSLGQNLGTPAEPAFAIGTRNAETFMRLRNGETAILGGLIRDEERNTRVRVPGLGDIPIVGALFTSVDDSTTRSEVLLTLTPRIMRSWDLPERSTLQFYSGTGETYTSRPMFSSLKVAPGIGQRTVGPLPEVRTVPGGGQAGGRPAAPKPAPAPAASLKPTLGFAQPVFEVPVDETAAIGLTGTGLAGVREMTADVLYNPQVLSFVRAERVAAHVQRVQADADAAAGAVHVRLSLRPEAESTESEPLVRLVMRGRRQGISYLVYKVPQLVKDDGTTSSAQTEAARMAVR